MAKGTMQALWDSSHLGGDSSAYLEILYENYLIDPSTVSEQWRQYFTALPKVNGLGKDVAHSIVQQQFLERAQNKDKILSAERASWDAEHERKQVRVLQLIQAYRTRGHQYARLDPLELSERAYIEDLDLAHYELSEQDFATQFNTGSLVGSTRASLKDIYDALLQTYCNTIGAEYMHITDTRERSWIQHRLEGARAETGFDADTRRQLLEKISAAEGMERYLHTKYVGQKRFSLEGGESLIPMLDELIQRSGAQGVKEIGIGMAHRGRLNVLVNILGKIPRELFEEFEGRQVIEEMSSGDVKYHQGFSSDVMTPGGDVHLALAFNPSHLEIVSPVVEGSVRARQERRGDKNRKLVLPVLIHGDAAFAGQGVVMENFNMSQARGYKTGGSIHIVINNQIGFTTSNQLDTRSTLYCTDVAKMVQAPIFHVNADDPEAVLHITQVALDYRMTFKKDVVIDLVCYRRHGHNEADEPSATQPLMYKKIKQHATTRSLYAQRLMAEKVMTEAEDTAIVDNYRNAMDAGDVVVTNLCANPSNPFAVNWHPYLNHEWTVAGDTTLDKAELQRAAELMLTLPEGFNLQKQVAKIISDRRKMTAGEIPLDWGYAENLAYATLLLQDYPIRISGQDSCRGTFAHRHAVLHDQETGETYVALRNLSTTQPQFLVIDSLLSEEAVLGFEYGYATTEPAGLVIWEAQFGDFANGAQVVIDQFISSGEIKWGRLSGLILLLPHGYEGMGPEHSSARLERYLQLCAERNMQVCVPTTPAQVYHMLRRQAIRPFRKPLVVMTPKSLLRHKLAVSTLDELATGCFQPVIDEIDSLDSNQVTRLVLCSGKVYYDLLAARRKQSLTHCAIIRVEQLYPFPEDILRAKLQQYPSAKDVIWCQEEPMNQGAWYCCQHHMRSCLAKGQKLQFVGRPASAAPAAGLAALHKQQQLLLIMQALHGD